MENHTKLTKQVEFRPAILGTLNITA
jgi:hypothetical protein